MNWINKRPSGKNYCELWELTKFNLLPDMYKMSNAGTFSNEWKKFVLTLQ